MNKNNVFELLPKNKFDDSTINQLMDLSEEEIKPIMENLFEWIADFNWPIASKICMVLLMFPDSLLPILQKTLDEEDPANEDEMLKYWILVQIIPQLQENHKQQLLKSLQRICKKPTVGEIDSGVYEIVLKWAGSTT